LTNTASPLEMRSLVASVGEELLQERIHSEQGGKQQNAAVTVLDIGGMNDGNLGWVEGQNVVPDIRSAPTAPCPRSP
jgi:hypothetical protein